VDKSSWLTRAQTAVTTYPHPRLSQAGTAAGPVTYAIWTAAGLL
jgi:hypothetical protein